MKTSDILLFAGLAWGAYAILKSSTVGATESGSLSTPTGTSTAVTTADTTTADTTTTACTSASCNSSSALSQSVRASNLIATYGEKNIIATDNPLAVTIKEIGGGTHQAAVKTTSSADSYAAKISNIKKMISEGAYSAAKVRDLKKKYNL